MYRQVHSAPDHDHSPDANASTSDINYHRTSEQSSTPLQPLMASRLHRNPTSQEKHIHVAATPLNSYPPTPGTLESGDANAQARKRASHFIHEGLSYDPSNAKEDYLRMAKDDIPDNKVSSAPSAAAAACKIPGSLGACTVLGGPFLPLPPWCIQNHTLVSAIFLPRLQRHCDVTVGTLPPHPK